MDDLTVSPATAEPSLPHRAQEVKWRLSARSARSRENSPPQPGSECREPTHRKSAINWEPKRGMRVAGERGKQWARQGPTRSTSQGCDQEDWMPSSRARPTSTRTHVSPQLPAAPAPPVELCGWNSALLSGGKPPPLLGHDFLLCEMTVSKKKPSARGALAKNTDSLYSPNT